MTTLAEVWGKLPGLAQRGASGRLIVGPVNLQRADLDFNWNVVGDFCENAAWKVRPREANIIRLYELVGIPVPEGRSPRDSIEEAEAAWGNGELRTYTRELGDEAMNEEGEEEWATEDEAVDEELPAEGGVDTGAGETWVPPSAPAAPVPATDAANPAMPDEGRVGPGAGETLAPLSGQAAPVPATAAGKPAMPECKLPAQGGDLPVVAPEQNPATALQRNGTSVFVAFREGDSITTAASTIATPPPARANSSPPSTEKLPLPASRKRTLLQALEVECANIEMLLKAKGELAAKRALEAAQGQFVVSDKHLSCRASTSNLRQSTNIGPGAEMDRVDTYPMETGVAEEVLHAARIEVHHREKEQEMQKESQPEPELSAELRGTTLVLGQRKEDEAELPREPDKTSKWMDEDDNRTIFFDPENMAWPEVTGAEELEPLDPVKRDDDKPVQALDVSCEADDEKPVQASDGSGEAHDEKLAQALDGSCEANGEKPVQALDGSGEAHDEKLAQALDGSGEANGEKPVQALDGSGEAIGEKPVQALDGSGEADGEKPVQAWACAGEADDEKPVQALDGTGEPVPESSGSPDADMPTDAVVETGNSRGCGKRGRGGGRGRGRGKAPETVPEKVSEVRGKSRRKHGVEETEPDEPEKASRAKPKKDKENGSGKIEPNKPKKERGDGSERNEPDKPKKAASKANPKLTEKEPKPGVEQDGAEKPAPKRKKPDVKELTEEERCKKQLKSRKSCAYHWARAEALNLGFTEEEAKQKGQEVFWL
ncbi:OGG1 [Symbiodinium sp. CCMP2592]|nr:OGG1 [Symbiodinium sp. CCMP2592]